MTVEKESNIELPYVTNSKELMEEFTHSSFRGICLPLKNTVVMNFGKEEDPKLIKIYDGLSSKEYDEWYKFFLSEKMPLLGPLKTSKAFYRTSVNIILFWNLILNHLGKGNIE